MATLDSKVPKGPIKDKWTDYKNHIDLVNPANKRHIDVIVVGTGLAGGSAAATLAELVKKQHWKKAACRYFLWFSIIKPTKPLMQHATMPFLKQKSQIKALLSDLMYSFVFEKLIESPTSIFGKGRLIQTDSFLLKADGVFDFLLGHFFF